VNKELTLKAAGKDLQMGLRRIESAKERFQDAHHDAFVMELACIIDELRFTLYNYNIVMGKENDEF